MPLKPYVSSSLALLTWLWLPVTAQTTAPPELLVASDDPSPLGAAASLGNVNVPVMNERGEFLFFSRNPQPDPDLPGSFFPRPALMLGDGTGLRPLGWEGEPYPGQSEIFYFLFSVFDDPDLDTETLGHRLNDATAAVFLQEARSSRFINPWPAGVPNGDAIWHSAGGRRALVAGRYKPAPGIPEQPGWGPPYFDSFSRLCWNNNGFHVFRAVVNGPLQYGGAFYSGRGGGLSLVHHNDSTSPTLFHPKLARDVDVVFFEGVEPPRHPLPASGTSLYRAVGAGRAERVAGPLEPLPGRPQGAEHIVLWDVDAVGNALFEGRNPNVNTTSNGLWEETAFGEGRRRLVSFGQEIQTPEGPLLLHHVHAEYGLESRRLAPRHRGGRTTFLAVYTGFGRTENLGLFQVDAQGEIRLVFSLGGSAPGTAQVFADWLQVSDVDLGFAVNATGLTAFRTKSRPAGDNGPATDSLWIEDTAGALHLVLRQGEMLNVRGAGRTVDRIAFDEATALTDSGLLVFHVWFVEGGSAIYRAVAPGAAALTGSLAGRVRSALPTLTPEEHAVHRATITVYEQPAGRLRPQRPDETDAAYGEFVRAQLGRVVKKTPFTREAGGGFFIPGLNALKPAGEGVLRHAFYAIEVSGGETQEWPSADDTSRTVPLHFLPRRLVNFSVPTVDALIELQPLDELGIKQNLADNLSDLAPQNWKPIEDEVDAYLAGLGADPAALTETDREALRRGIWAERAFVLAADFADELIKAALQSLGAVLADAFGEVMKSESDVLRKAKARVEKARGLMASPQFKTGRLGNDARAAASEADWSLVTNAELTGNMSNLMKLLKPLIEKGLVKSGVEPARAKQLADAAVLLYRSIFNALKDGGMNNTGRGWAAASLALQEAIKFTVNQSRPLFFDGPPEFGFPFATVVSPQLRQSVEWMKGWDSHDEAAFLRDREAFRKRLDEFIQTQGVWINATIVAQAGGEYFSSVEAFMGILGTGLKWAKAAEKASKALKYASNLEGVLIPLAVVYGYTPDEVAALTHLAFGQPPPAPRQASPRRPVLPRDTRDDVPPLPVAAPEAALLGPALQRLRLALAGHDIGATIEAAVDAGSAESLATVHAAWKRDFTRFHAGARAMAAVALDALPAAELNALSSLRFSQFAAEAAVGAALGELFEGVLTGGFTSAAAPEYLAARADVLAALTRFERALARTSAQLAAVESALAGAPTSGSAPPVLVLEPAPILSASGPVRTITQDPQVFTVRLTAFNPGPTALPALSVELTARGPAGGAVIDTPRRNLPALPPGTGAPLEWTLTCTGAAAGGGVALTAEVPPDQPGPENGIVLAAEWFLLADPALTDPDLDGLSNPYELAHGLNPQLDDASLDPDGDGLTNLQEFHLGTDPRRADTDSDGVSDGAEAAGLANGQRTDPLLADTDGDGANDRDDGDPLNPESTAPLPAQTLPLLIVPPLRIVLTPEAPSALLPVTNAGDGLLLLRAEADSPGLFTASPAELRFTTGGTVLIRAAAPFPPLEGRPSILGTVTLRNLASGLPQEVPVHVILARNDDPMVTIHKAGGTIVIDWSVTGRTYLLEQSPDLSLPAGWQPVPLPVQENGDQWRVILPLEADRRFFRLRRP